MNGVIFNEKHTHRDWGLLLRRRPQISPPAPKTKLIQVPGSDAIIDLTCNLCRLHQQSGFIAALKLAHRLSQELNT